MKVLSRDALIAIIKLRLWDSLSIEDVEEIFEKYGDDYSDGGNLVAESPNAMVRNKMEQLLAAENDDRPMGGFKE